MMDCSSQEKKSLRTTMMNRRHQVLFAEAVQASLIIKGHLCAVISNDAPISGYKSVRGELDVTPAMVNLCARGNTLCLPVIEAADKPLYFRKWMPEEILENGQFGIQIPNKNADIVIPEILLIPLLAFDRQGVRVGYGAGYYDRTIAHLKNSGKHIYTIGIAYSFQEVDFIRIDSHDQKLDSIITEKERIHIR